jgi:hypothetical protein
MSLDDRLTNPMFLLSLTPLATACPAGDDTSSDGPTTSQPTPNVPTTGGETEQPQTATGMDGTGTGTTAEPGTTGTTVDPDTTAGETTAGLMCDERPPPVDEIDPACVAFNEQYNECYYDGMLPQECIDLYTAYCQAELADSIMEYGEMCGMAIVEFYTCLTQLSCQELRMTEEPCPAEIMAVDMACGGK